MSDQKIYGLSQEEAAKLSNIELLKHYIREQKAYAETLPLKEHCDLLEKLNAIVDKQIGIPIVTPFLRFSKRS